MKSKNLLYGNEKKAPVKKTPIKKKAMPTGRQAIIKKKAAPKKAAAKKGTAIKKTTVAKKTATPKKSAVTKKKTPTTRKVVPKKVAVKKASPSISAKQKQIIKKDVAALIDAPVIRLNKVKKGGPKPSGKKPLW